MTLQSNRKVGFWYSASEPHLPKPVPSNESPDKEFLLQLDKVEAEAQQIAYRGWSHCRICDKTNGSRSFVFRGFEWPEGYSHYISDHGVKPDEDFREMVMKVDFSPIDEDDEDDEEDYED